MARLTRAERQTQTRRALIDAAQTLFARRGYHATTLDQIAERAGMTTGAVYSNFAGKQDLLFAVLERLGPTMDDPVFGNTSIEFPARIRLYARRLVSEWDRFRDVILLFGELELLAARDAKVRNRMRRMLDGMYRQRGPALDVAATSHGISLPMDGARWLQLTGAAIRGLLQERLVAPRMIDEQMLGDALLILSGYTPADVPMPA